MYFLRKQFKRPPLLQLPFTPPVTEDEATRGGWDSWRGGEEAARRIKERRGGGKERRWLLEMVIIKSGGVES